jgi:hypothetical protein
MWFDLRTEQQILLICPDVTEVDHCAWDYEFVDLCHRVSRVHRLQHVV